MKPQFFDIEDLKTKPLRFWTSKLEHDDSGFFGNIYFVVNSRKFRVHFDCLTGIRYDAKFYYYCSRQYFNTRFAMSFRELLVKVYELLND